jgi:shikimate dehydrogenase
MKISGKTRITGVFGYPVKHTASPAFQNAAFEALKLNWVYLPFEVKPEELSTAVKAIKSLGIAGVNCTIPHKETVIQYLDEISNEAEAIGAVNTIRNFDGLLRGHNTDGKGFMRSLAEIEPSGVKGKTVFLMGSGGAGRAIAVQSALDGAKAIYLCDKDEARASVLTMHVQSKFASLPVKQIVFNTNVIADAVEKADIFVDATPLGMHPDDPISINTEWLRPATLVADLVYNPPETPLLKAAKKLGCRTLNGLGMLLHQGALAFEIWTGMKPPIDVMRKALEEAIYK